MADSKISDLAAVTDVLDTDAFVLARSGATKKITGATMRTEIPAMVRLFDSVLGADAASFDVSSIVQTYKHLQLLLQVRGTKAAQNCAPLLRFNNDSGSNYRWNVDYVASNASGHNDIQSGGDTSARIGLCPAASATAGAAAVIEILIPNYAGATFRKQATALGHAGDSGSGIDHSFRGGCGWLSTAAITRVAIFPDANNWLAGSRLTIYGLN